MKPLLIPQGVLRTTLEALQPAGVRGREAVVLWLAEKVPEGSRIRRVYAPAHQATDDMFRIPRSSIEAILDLVGQTGFAVAAQVHTHPAEAFQSLADDRWAIVRHEGALSIVLPRFALDTDVATFWKKAAVFQLTRTNRWAEVPEERRAAVLREER